MTDRLAAVQAAMREDSFDALVVAAPPNVAYVSGFQATPHERLIAVVVPLEGPLRVVAPSLEADAARAAAREGTEFFIWLDEEGPASALAGALRGVEGRVGIENAYLSVANYELVRSSLADPSLDDCGPLLGALRIVKEEGEIDLLRRAAGIVDVVIERLAGVLAPGRTEVELAMEVARFAREEGADGLGFEPAILTGAKSALPHGHTDGTAIAEGDLVIVDISTTVGGYHADISRTFVVGREPDERQRELFDVVREAQLAGVRAAVPGSTAADVDRAARQMIAAAGLGDRFVHRTGHGLGLEVHEPPYLTATNEEPLAEGMVVTVEPGVYIEGYGGVRIEDDVVVRAGEPEVLTKAPIALEPR